MPVETIYVHGDDARGLWDAWTEALAARVDHELACRLAGGGCNTRGQLCLVGLDLHEAEQAAHRTYSATVNDEREAA